jgi:hypothetical protein
MAGLARMRWLSMCRRRGGRELLQGAQESSLVEEREVCREVLFVNLKLNAVSRQSCLGHEVQRLTSSFQTFGVSNGDLRASSDVPRASFPRCDGPDPGIRLRFRFRGLPCEARQWTWGNARSRDPIGS